MKDGDRVWWKWQWPYGEESEGEIVNNGNEDAVKVWRLQVCLNGEGDGDSGDSDKNSDDDDDDSESGSKVTGVNGLEDFMVKLWWKTRERYKRRENGDDE